jgi:2-polyprenyl-6-methoxyphenol hydroxylase-like FAD-dependent oxidoreductase
MPRWYDGHVVLLGDSAWSTSPLSGLGTALALRGAAELAAALHAHSGADAVPAALAAFEATMRPRVTSAQQLPPGRVAAAAPKTTRGIWLNAFVMRAIQSRTLRPLVRRAFAGSEHGRTAENPSAQAKTAAVR